MDRYGLNPCGEIIGRDFHCNLAEVHLNTLDPERWKSTSPTLFTLLAYRWLHFCNTSSFMSGTSTLVRSILLLASALLVCLIFSYTLAAPNG